MRIYVSGNTAGMVGPVLSYELLERHSETPGKLLGQQAAAGNFGQALDAMGAGSLVTVAAAVPLWAAAVVLLIGAALSLVWWGTARQGEMAG